MNNRSQELECNGRKKTKNRPPSSPSESDEKLEQLIQDLHITQSVRDELTSQGRSMVWLAKKLGVGRTSLYYLFRSDSISVELLLRISFCLNHNFVQDVADLYDAKL